MPKIVFIEHNGTSHVVEATVGPAASPATRDSKPLNARRVNWNGVVRDPSRRRC